MFKAKCWKCGKEATGIAIYNWNKDKSLEDIISSRDEHKAQNKFEASYHRSFCINCFENYKKEYNEKLNNYLQLKIWLMHERAVKIIENSLTCFMDDLKESCDEVLKFNLKKQNLASADEVIVAIMLLDESYEFKIQYQIGKYRVDFFIPEEKIVLEVDGYMHEHKNIEDSKRDIEIRGILGKDWEVVRIPTKYIEQNPMAITQAMIEMKKEKQKLRKANNGIIPENFSKRESSHYKKILENINKKLNDFEDDLP